MDSKFNQIAKELHQTTEVLSSIFNLNPDAIALTRLSDGKIIDCNQEFLDEIGYQRKEVIGRTTTDIGLYTPQFRKRYTDAIESGGYIHNMEVTLQKKNGERGTILASARVIEVGGEKVLLNIGRDITQRIKKENEKQQLIEELDVVNEELTSSNDELQSANRKLRESSELYRQFFNSPLKGFVLGELVLDEEGKPYDIIYLRVNRVYEEFVGRKSNEILDKSIRELYPANEAAEIIQMYANVVLDGEELHIEQYRPTYDKYYEIYAFPYRGNQFISTLVDITSHRKAEEEALKAKKEWEHTFHAVPDLIALIDVDHTILRVNKPMADRLNIREEDCVGKKCYELIHGLSEPLAICPHKSMLEDGKDHTTEAREESLDGDFIVSASPILDDYELLAGVHVLRDITKRKQAELKVQEMLEMEQTLTEELKVSNEELQDITQELQTSNEKLQSTAMELQMANHELVLYQNSLQNAIEKLEISNRELEQFAYVASHDLQEPLRMVSSFTQLLEKRYKGQLDDDADDFIDYIVEGAKRMKDLIDDLLAFSRLHTASREFHTYDMNGILEDVLTSIRPSIDASNARITYDTLPHVKVDNVQMGQLFQNLISNAMKFQNSTPEIHISAQENGDFWQISVRDNGIGIKTIHQDKIFDVFKRLHTREEYEGTGIGLSICKRIVEIHGGDIWVESRYGEGSTFYFTVPKQ